VEEIKPGPRKGSSGAKKIGLAHRGPHAHDNKGGFAADPTLAREAGKKGGDTIKKKYGMEFYRKIGVKGGNKVKTERGSSFYAEMAG